MNVFKNQLFTVVSCASLTASIGYLTPDYFPNTLAQSLNQSTLYARTPNFRDYPVENIYKGKPAPVDLSSNPKARQYRDALRYGAKLGPNFAGHYTVVMWGCGSPCQNFAIINAKTGKVYMSDITTSFGLSYQINSNLLIVNPDIPPESADLYGKPKYYIWKNGRLQKL